MSRILGIDYGSKRIGLAISDKLRIVSSPLAVLPNNIIFPEELKKICTKYQVNKIVIGYPYSEKYTEASEDVMRFSQELKKYINIDIDFQNEENSSIYSESLLKSMGIKEKKIKASLDKYAAQKILEDYLKSKC